MWHTVVLIVHVFVAFSLIGLVLLQRGKGAEAGTGFGAGASGTVFGARGSANFLSRTTAVLATLFFVTCLSLVYLSTQAPRATGLVDRAAEQERSTQTTVTGGDPPSLEIDGSQPAPASTEDVSPPNPDGAPGGRAEQ